MTVSSAAVSVLFQASRGSVHVNDIGRDYEEHGGLVVNHVLISGGYLDTLFEQDLLWAQAGDSTESREERLSIPTVLIDEIRCVVPVSNKYCVHLVQWLAEEVKDASQK